MGIGLVIPISGESDINFQSIWHDYGAISGVIENVVLKTVHKFKVPDMTPDDLAQEVRFKCFTAMEQFDPHRIGPNPYKYLQTVAHNHVYNLCRGWMLPNNPPCFRCELYDASNKTCTVNEVGCDKIVIYRQKMQKKTALRTVPETNIEPGQSDAHGNLNAAHLNDHFRAKLPASLVEPYDKMIAGNTIPSYLKQKIRKLIRQIINETL